MGQRWRGSVESMTHPDIPSEEFRRVLGRFPTGVTVVTSNGPDGPVGVAIGSFASVSLDPPLVGFFLGKQASTWSAIEAAGHFCVNILGAHQLEECGVMASRDPNKFDGVTTTPAPISGAPVLDGAVGWIDCTMWAVYDGGDHHIVLGRVMALDAVHDVDPMVFLGGTYGRHAV